MIDPRQTVRWAYAFLLGREPENESAIDQHIQIGGADRDAIRQRIVGSPEFAEVMARDGFEPVARSASAGPLEGMLGAPPAGAEGYFTDRFGVRTRVNYLPSSYQAYSGQVGSADGRFDMPVHETEELNALLRSVSAARLRFCVMELGAGWGPWIVLGAHLARRRGLSYELTGVEGAAEHVAFMQTHMIDNAIEPALHRVVHAVVGVHDGVARFPKLPDPSGDWGAEASYNPDQNAVVEMEEVPCVSLQTLLDDVALVDFLHCDIQGAEADVFREAMPHVNQKVRRTCIGTHSRAIEANLFELFIKESWILEYEQPCRVGQVDGTLHLIADGVQVWRNANID